MVWELREGNEKQAGPGKGRIRPAEESDLSRIGEIFVFNNRMYYWPIFQDDEYSFNVMQVVPVINAYFGKEENRKRIFVYDDGLVKGFCELGEKEIRKLYVEPFFQSQGIGGALLKEAVFQHGARFLWALEKNKRAISFYERNGFRLTGEKRLEEGTKEYLVLLACNFESLSTDAKTRP